MRRSSLVLGRMIAACEGQQAETSRVFYGVRSALPVLLLIGCAGPPVVPLPPAPQPLPAMTFTDLDGGERTVDEFAGKVVLLDFWATWCGPCKQSLPLYNRWQGELAGELVVVAVSVDERMGPVAPFAQRVMPDVEVWYDRDHVGASILALPAMPTAFLIDRQGHLVGTHVGFEQEDAQPLRERLDALVAP